MSSGGGRRSKTWRFHVPSPKPKRKIAKAKATAKPLGKPKRRFRFNDPSKVPPARPRNAVAEQWERNNSIPGVRHEVPLGEPWDCKYGCTPFVWMQGQLHGHKCPYWNNEGGLRTPF